MLLDKLLAIPFKLYIKRKELEKKLVTKREKWTELRLGKFI